MKTFTALVFLLATISFPSAVNSKVFDADVDEVYTFEKRKTHEGWHTCAVPSQITARTPRVCCLDEESTLNIEYQYLDASGFMHPTPYCRNTEENQPTEYGEE